MTEIPQIGCDRADTLVRLDASASLDPACTWTGGIEIVASNVLFDCRGASIVNAGGRFGILVSSDAGSTLSKITVRNCHIEGFLNNVRISRDGFRELAEGSEYDHAWSDIVVEDSTLMNSGGAGVFIDGYVTGVTLRNLYIEGSGSTGIYLEAGSKDNVIEHNRIVNNGYKQNGPGGQLHKIAGLNFWFWGTGREGLAVDGSRNNRIMNNYFSGNSAGAIFLYKNCGEFEDQRPESWFQRRYGADSNFIEGNIFEDEVNGVWIASRMGENVLFMDCSDPYYLLGFVLDHARDNVVRGNTFRNVSYGIRVEDDGSVIENNIFYGDDASQLAVVIGTRFRSLILRRPVDRTVIKGNQAFITGNANPYRWVHGHRNTDYGVNQSLDQAAAFCAGRKLPRNSFIFVVDYQLADPDNPPAGETRPGVTPMKPLPQCP